ncbi:hypothetical protein EJ08DRAFT_224445 [Tothia fuscella]|uniref:Uncharacterized protein n=1 Tax=Tothia fuscella TaxID=1048955 RepID=A0A9P4P3G1_9PEZI|nr:hypothetical protein EJ08DRAFT_224445 [Tothia fuscella]
MTYVSGKSYRRDELLSILGINLMFKSYTLQSSKGYRIESSSCYHNMCSPACFNSHRCIKSLLLLGCAFQLRIEANRAPISSLLY